MPDISFVAIGYNEGATLRACLDSVRNADMAGLTSELFYVDAGSDDDSRRIAEDAGVDGVLGGERRRRAAECRNLGLASARADFVQFLDGDMEMAADWPRIALDFLKNQPEMAAVCGNLEEANRSLLFRALQIDWAPREGVIRHCGGAALFRRAALEKAGAFPEHLEYGEEPLLCWRIRNDLGLQIYQFKRRMAYHHLGFRGLRDYWRREVRCGATYAEVAACCRKTNDRLWLKECISNTAWLVLLLAGSLLLLLGTVWLRFTVILIALVVLARKWVQTVRKGNPLGVSLVYAVHTYFSKIPLALGQLKWLARRAPRGAS